MELPKVIKLMVLAVASIALASCAAVEPLTEPEPRGVHYTAPVG